MCQLSKLQKVGKLPRYAGVVVGAGGSHATSFERPAKSLNVWGTVLEPPGDDLLEEIISWRFKNSPPNIEAFRRAFKARGVGSAGPHYNTSIPWQFAYFLKFAELAHLDHTDLADPASGKSVADRALQAVPKAVEARHIVLHLLFPDEFERIAS